MHPRKTSTSGGQQQDVTLLSGASSGNNTMQSKTSFHDSNSNAGMYQTSQQ